MIDKSQLARIKNILNIHNNADLQFVNDIIRGYRDDDQALLFYSIAELFNDISPLKDNISEIIKLLKEEKDYELISLLSKQKYNTDLLDRILHIAKDDIEIFNNLLDSFSDNQVTSKTALLGVVNKLNILTKETTVVIWGSWYGSILIPKLAPKVKRVVCIDLDNEPLQIAKNKLFNDYENIDYICGDLFEKYRDTYIDTNLIINTSCEHMPPMKEWKWFQKGALSTDSQYKHKFSSPKLSDNCYFVFQSNNMDYIEDHVNCVYSLEEFKSQLPERAEVLYEEEVADTRGTRFMLVGKFMPL
jgi:hypothetical protein